jgi:DNA polymerase-3 subunit delta'
VTPPPAAKKSVSASAPPATPPSAHNFDSIHGHDLIKRYLTSAMGSQALPHALLFHGPRGVGKTSMAYALAKTLNCPNGGRGECACDVCRKISTQVFSDLVVVEPKGAAGQITLAGWKPGREEADTIPYYRFVDSRPLEGGRKILMLRQADRMNTAMANHLLKLIEEPPSYLTLILVTHRPGDLLTTVRSRCAPLKFNPLEQSEMEEFARSQDLSSADSGTANLLRLAEGRPGLLIDLISGDLATRRKATASAMDLFQQHGFLMLFRAASELGKSPTWGAGGEVFETTLQTLQAWVRDAILLKVMPEGEARKLMLNSDVMEAVKTYAAQNEMPALLAAYDELQNAFEYTARQTDKAYVLETLLMRLGRLKQN